MSSINLNNLTPAASTDRTTTGQAQAAATPSLAGLAPSSDANRPGLLSLDGFGRAGGQAGDITKSAPPIAHEMKPSDYTTNLQGAQQNMSAFQSTSFVSPAEMQMLAQENQANQRVADKGSAEFATRQTKTENQSQSIVASAEEAHKKGCATKHDNHQENVQKMQALGFTKNQAKTMVATLENKNVPADVKNKLAYQLAAVGMTGKGGPIAGSSIATNAAGIKKQLGDFADAQRSALKDAVRGKVDRFLPQAASRGETDKVFKDTGSRLNGALGGNTAALPDESINVPMMPKLSSQTLNTASLQGLTLNGALQNLRPSNGQGA